jgi:hypothetical protein
MQLKSVSVSLAGYKRGRVKIRQEIPAPWLADVWRFQPLGSWIYLRTQPGRTMQAAYPAEVLPTKQLLKDRASASASHYEWVAS